MRFRIAFVVIVFAVSEFVLSKANAERCKPLVPPQNGAITRCRNGFNHQSVCTAVCNAGYKLEGGSRTLCWCGGGECSWRGLNPSCKVTNCEVPDYDVGRVRMVDEWPHGFAAVVELDNIPDFTNKLKSGWSIAIVFDRPLGVNATIKCWNAETAASSYDRQSITLINAKHNMDLSKYLPSGNIRWVFMADKVAGSRPKAAYIGLYNRRVRDTTCLQAPRMTNIESIYAPVIKQPEETEPPVTAKKDVSSYITSKPTQQPELTKSATTRRPETTTEVTTTKQETTVSTTTVESTTEKTVIAVTAPKKGKFRRRRRKPKKKTTTPTMDTTTYSSTESILPTTAGYDDTTTSMMNDTEDITLEKVGERYCLLQKAEDSYKTQDGWEDGGEVFFSGNAILNVGEHLLDWAMLMIFNTPIAEIQVWSCSVVDKSKDGQMWTFGPNSWNLDLYPGESDINFIAKQVVKTSYIPTAKVYLCSYAFTEGDAVIITPDVRPEEREETSMELPNQEEEEEIEVETDDTIITSDKWKKSKKASKRCARGAPNGVIPKKQGQMVLNFKPNNDGTRYNYNELLHKSILFYEAQRAGILPANNRIPWRGHSTLKDGCDIGVDLSGGWFDAGDHVKFHLPMAFSATMLIWGGLMFQDAYKDAGEIVNLRDSVNWPITYLIKCHISKFEFVGQVGSGHIDHITYGRPEEMTMERPSYVLSPEKPGSEVTAETAAALASASIFLKQSHPIKAKNALRHAKELYEFAETYKANYHNSITDVKDFYFSYSGYDDELIWAAAWLYKATNDKEYLLKAKSMYVKLGGQYAVESEFSWDRKLIAAQILLANLTGEEIYRKPVGIFLKNLLKAKATPKGLFWVRKWGPNRYAANVAFAVLAASTLEPPLPNMDVYVEWARKQIHLLLGDIGRSYVVGFGKNYPQRVHHRSSFCKPYPKICNRQAFYTSDPNYYILHGGLVGGPDQKEIYSDNRAVYEQTEVACDYNAGFQGAVAGLKQIAMKNRKPSRNRSNVQTFLGK